MSHLQPPAGAGLRTARERSASIARSLRGGAYGTRPAIAPLLHGAQPVLPAGSGRIRSLAASSDGEVAATCACRARPLPGRQHDEVQIVGSPLDERRSVPALDTIGPDAEAAEQCRGV
jgi:hypothetical protein